MNFNDLYKKIASLDTPVSENVESTVEECGMPPTASMPAPKQSDSVTMNVSMNGSGAGGIRDLMSILKSIEDGDEEKMSDFELDDKDDDGMDMPLIIKTHKAGDMIEKEAFANSPDEQYGSTADVTPSGDDLHKSKGAYVKAAGGDNPMAIKTRLESLYQEIKNR